MNEAESAAMWQLYSTSADSICICTTYSHLRDALPEYCYMGVIRYVDFEQTPIQNGNMFDPFMAKRLSFSHEREVRIIVTGHDYLLTKNAPEPPPIKHITIHLPDLYAEIYVNPKAPEWFRDVVVNLCQIYDFIGPINYSDLARDPIY